MDKKSKNDEKSHSLNNDHTSNNYNISPQMVQKRTNDSAIKQFRPQPYRQLNIRDVSPFKFKLLQDDDILYKKFLLSTTNAAQKFQQANTNRQLTSSINDFNVNAAYKMVDFQSSLKKGDELNFLNPDNNSIKYGGRNNLALSESNFH